MYNSVNDCVYDCVRDCVYVTGLAGGSDRDTVLQRTNINQLGERIKSDLQTKSVSTFRKQRIS